MRSVYQRCSEKHLQRYLAEYDFRYNNRIALGVDDVARTELAVLGVIGKRLTDQTTSARRETAGSKPKAGRSKSSNPEE